VLGINERMQGKGSRSALPPTRHRRSIHYGSSHVARGVGKGIRAPLTTGDTPKIVEERA